MSRIFLISAALLLLWAPMSSAQFEIQPDPTGPEWARWDPQSLVAESRSFPPMWLVQARVTEEAKVKSEDGTFALTLEVTSVYWGSDALIGKTFKGRTGTEAYDDGFSGRIIPPRHKGTIGIFVLQTDTRRIDDQIRSFPGGFGLNFPVSENEQPLYTLAKAHAEAIGKLRGASRDAQIALLKQYAQEGPVPLALWSIPSLTSNKEDKPATAEFMEHLLEAPKRDIYVQIQVDNALLALRGQEWQNSAPRIALLKRWVNSEHNENDWYSVYSHLEDISQRHQLDGVQIFDLLDMMVANKSTNAETRRRAVYLMNKISQKAVANQAALQDTVFKLLIQQVRDNKEVKNFPFQRDAARKISELPTLSPEQTAQVAAVQKEVTNKEVTALLEKVLNKKSPEISSNR